VSDTAEYGDYVSGPCVIDAHVRETMKGILKDIQSGKFANDWIEENRGGQRKNFLAMRKAAQDQPVEQVGAKLREMMTFLKKKKAVGTPQAEPAAVGD
jgi:ketol-acid reductoisomerase